MSVNVNIKNPKDMSDVELKTELRGIWNRLPNLDGISQIDSIGVLHVNQALIGEALFRML